jgi:hypothetical protein
MEDPTIAKMNLERFRRLLESEADPAKRRTIQELIPTAEAALHHQRSPRAPPRPDSFAPGGSLK